MLLTEHALPGRREGARDASHDFQLFATDASAEIVACASRGVFAPAAVEGLSPERRGRFLYVADGAYRIKRALREKMVFARHDLLADPPFSGLDLVICRNLLIYLEPEAIERVLWFLHAALLVGGHLFIGRAAASRSTPGSSAGSPTGSIDKMKPLFEHRPTVGAKLGGLEPGRFVMLHDGGASDLARTPSLLRTE